MHDVMPIRTGVLTYGSVELCLSAYYSAGETIHVGGQLYLQVVDGVEKADGIVILGLVERSYQQRPACLAVLFTHYLRHPIVDRVDHAATIIHLSDPTERLRRESEHAFQMDMIKRSVASSLAYTPQLRYL